MCGTVERVGAAVATGGLSEGVRMLSPGAPPGAPQLPAYPTLSPEEQDLLKKQGISLDQLNTIISGDSASLANNKNILQGLSGLYDSDGNINQQALDDLKGRVQGRLGLQSQIGDQALNFLGTFFDQPTDPLETQIVQSERQRYADALNGNAPASVALTQQKAKDFELLKESAGQRGIKIDGDSAESATSESSAGLRLLSDFKNQYALREDDERRATITSGGQQDLARLGFLENQRSARYSEATGLSNLDVNTQLGYLTSSNAYLGSNLAPVISSYINDASQIAQPYANYRMGVYNTGVNQANLNYQGDLAGYQAHQQFLQSIGQLGGTVASAYLMGPAGAAARGVPSGTTSARAYPVAADSFPVG